MTVNDRVISTAAFDRVYVFPEGIGTPGREAAEEVELDSAGIVNTTSERFRGSHPVAGFLSGGEPLKN